MLHWILKVYEIDSTPYTFRLKRYLVEVDELRRSYPRRARSGLDDCDVFDSLDLDQTDKAHPPPEPSWISTHISRLR